MEGVSEAEMHIIKRMDAIHGNYPMTMARLLELISQIEPGVIFTTESGIPYMPKFHLPIFLEASGETDPEKLYEIYLKEVKHHIRQK